MNVKTTGILFLLVVAVGVGIMILQQQSPPERPTLPKPKPEASATAEKKVIEESFDQVQRIDVAAAGNDIWTFERGDDDEWRITAPFDAAVQKWQVNQIARRLSELKYVITYDGQGDPSPADAGLEPPRHTVTLTADDDKTVTVEIGANRGDSETLVRLAGEPTIFRAKPSLKDLFKKRAIEYRDAQLFKDVSGDAIVRLTVTAPADEGSDTYALVKTGGEWRFEKPAPAKAMAEPVQRVITSWATLRVLEWIDDRVTDLNRYGLGDDVVRVTASVEIPNTTTDGLPPTIEEQTVLFSNVSPLGDDTKVYCMVAGDSAVGTIMKSVADKYRPNLKEWRDNRLTDRDPATARRLTLTRGDASTTLTRANLNWNYAGNDEPADKEAVSILLSAIRSTSAVNFVAGAAGDPAAFGLTDPQGAIQLAFDDGSEVMITVGGYADPDTRRLVYIQTDGSDTVAKVRVAEAQGLLRDARAFRDRTVLAVSQEQVQELTIRREVTTGSPVVTLERAADGTWQMSAPIKSKVNTKIVGRLTNLLADFRAQDVIDLGGDATLAGYGLDEPEATLAYTYMPPKAFKLNPDNGSNGSADAPRLTEVQPPAETVTVHAARKGDKVYLQRVGADDVVYVVGAGVMDDLLAEFRDPSVYNFEASQVSAVMLTQEGRTQGFKQSDTGWIFHPEPDIPIDASKVTNYLLRVSDLKVARVISYQPESLAAFGLDQPALELTVEVEGTPLASLRISAMTTGDGQAFAMSSASPEVFTLPSDTVDRVTIDIGEFEAQ